MMSTITPPLKYHGGKTYLAKWIQSLAPEGRYIHRVHPYGGGLGEFWNWPHEGISEVVNDIDGRLSYLWRVLQDDAMFAEFTRRIEAMPLSEPEWGCAATTDGNVSPVTIAVRFFVRIRQSRQGLMEDWATLSRTRTRRGMNEQASAWLTAIEGLPEVHARLKRVVITCGDGVELIRQQDGPKTLFYCDPPYLGPERSTPDTYAHEMTPEQHKALLEALAHIEGFFMLSGYHNPMYDGWANMPGIYLHEKRIDNKASGSKTKEVKTECVWTNYDAPKENS